MDNLANLFSKIQNGQNLHKTFVRVPFSKKSWNICNILFIEGLIKGFFFKENFIYIFLKYAQNEPVIKRIEKLSLQGRRLYTKKGLNGFVKQSVMIGLEQLSGDGLKSREESISLNSIQSISILDNSLDGRFARRNHVTQQTDAKYSIDTVDPFIRTNTFILAKSRSVAPIQAIQPSLVKKIKNLQFFKLRILSTSKGIMTERDSKFLGIGGEILCDIY